MSHEDEMLEYETEQDETPLPPIPPVPVYACEPVVTVETVPQHMSAYTFVMSTTNADQAVQQILPQDPLRVQALIIVHDQPVVICHSKNSAAAAANTAAGTLAPSGAYVSADPTTPSAPIPIPGVQEVWAAATYGEPARISVFAYRRSA